MDSWVFPTEPYESLYDRPVYNNDRQQRPVATGLAAMGFSDMT